MHTRLRALVPVLASLLLVAACDKNEEKKADAKAEKKAEAKKAEEPIKEAVKPEPAKADVLVLGAAKLKSKDQPEEVVEIAADGTVSMAGEVFVKISTDGKLSKPDGTVVGQVGPDGVVTADSKPMGVTLVEGGASVTTPDGKTSTVKFADDGSITIDPKPEKDSPDQMTTEGCTGPMAKTCALVLMALVLRSESAASAVPPSDLGPAAKPPTAG